MNIEEERKALCKSIAQALRTLVHDTQTKLEGFPVGDRLFLSARVCIDWEVFEREGGKKLAWGSLDIPGSAMKKEKA